MLVGLCENPFTGKPHLMPTPSTHTVMYPVKRGERRKALRFREVEERAEYTRPGDKIGIQRQSYLASRPVLLAGA